MHNIEDRSHPVRETSGEPDRAAGVAEDIARRSQLEGRCRASSGYEAVRVLRAAAADGHPHGLALLDVEMPEMDGLEAARLIRRREHDAGNACPWKSPVHIIALTANPMQGDREKCLAVGMDDYLSKPVRLGELQAALERWLAVPIPASSAPSGT